MVLKRHLRSASTRFQAYSPTFREKLTNNSNPLEERRRDMDLTWTGKESQTPVLLILGRKSRGTAAIPIVRISISPDARQPVSVLLLLDARTLLRADFVIFPRKNGGFRLSNRVLLDIEAT